VSGTKDIRVANVLIEVYAKLCMLEKAEELKGRSRRGGAKPNAKTWEKFWISIFKTKNLRMLMVLKNL
jgi:pentatricopeptide repeat protein